MQPQGSAGGTSSLGWLAAHVWRHLRLWQIQASQKSQMAPTSAMPVAFFPPCGTQQSLPRHLDCRTCFPERRFVGRTWSHAVPRKCEKTSKEVLMPALQVAMMSGVQRTW